MTAVDMDGVVWDDKPGFSQSTDSFDFSKIPLEQETWPVIIIGSSMVGKTLGLLLGYHGIASASFDQHAASATHPRAAGLNFRTGEILRQLGLERLTLEQSSAEFDLNAGMILVESLVSKKPPFRMQVYDAKETQEFTPSNWVWIAQSMFEPVLGQNAERFKHTQFHSHEVIHYQEQGDGVIVVVKNLETSEMKKFHTSYLVACDGGRSSTRQKEGIKWEGPGALRDSLNVSFDADLTPFVGDRAIHGVIYISNPNVNGGFRLEPGCRQGLFMINSIGDKVNFPPGTVTDDEVKSYFYQCSGIGEKDNPVTITKYGYWTMAAYVADRMTSEGGRVFLAGDSAHIMPPTGGLGGNTGIADAHNLAWKLAYVINKKASPVLLKSYSTERQPINKFTVDQAYKRYLNRVEGRKPMVAEVPDMSVELGYRYSNGAFLQPQETEDGLRYDNPGAPSVIAGSRFPHVWLRSDSEPGQISSIDLIKQDLVLIVTNPTSPWLNAATQIEIPIQTYVINETSTPYRDHGGSFQKKTRLGNEDALLVRPDGFIAWRAEKIVNNHLEHLRKTVHSIFGISS